MASAMRYADLNAAIPLVPSVTGVADEVILEMDFVAIHRRCILYISAHHEDHPCQRRF
jgi:hypothetical protein